MTPPPSVSHSQKDGLLLLVLFLNTLHCIVPIFVTSRSASRPPITISLPEDFLHKTCLLCTIKAPLCYFCSLEALSLSFARFLTFTPEHPGTFGLMYTRINAPLRDPNTMPTDPQPVSFGFLDGMQFQWTSVVSFEASPVGTILHLTCSAERPWQNMTAML